MNYNDLHEQSRQFVVAGFASFPLLNFEIEHILKEVNPIVSGRSGEFFIAEKSIKKVVNALLKNCRI